MIDLDALATDWDEGNFMDEMDAVRAAQRTIPTLIAELRASRQVVEAAEEVRYEIARMTGMGEVPQLKQIAFWRDRIQKALGELSLVNDMRGSE